MTLTFDRVAFKTATTGTGTVDVGDAISPAFLTPTEAGAQNGDAIPYIILDGYDFEIGTGTYSTGSPDTFARTTVTVSKIGGTVGTSKINLSGGGEVRFGWGATQFAGLVDRSGVNLLSGSYPYDFHDYGALSNDDIEIDPRYHFGVIERDNTSNEIMAPATPPDHHIAIRILIVGTSSTGSPSLTGWDNTDQGDDLPGEDEMAWLRIDLSPEAMTAVVEAINY